MIHPPAPSPPRCTGHGPRTRQALTALGGTAILLTAAAGLAPAASAAPATLPPPEPSVVPVPSPPPLTAAPAHFPLWAVAAIVAATIVLSVATTLITLSLEHLRRARRTPAAAAEPRADTLTSTTAPGPETGQAEILTSHHHTAGHGLYQTDSHLTD
jgi:hypothetical protein